jgi:hypothetical protein
MEGALTGEEKRSRKNRVGNFEGVVLGVWMQNQ